MTDAKRRGRTNREALPTPSLWGVGKPEMCAARPERCLVQGPPLASVVRLARGKKRGRQRISRALPYWSVACLSAFLSAFLSALRRVLLLPPQTQLQRKSQGAGRFRVHVLVEGGRVSLCQCDRLSRTVKGPSEASKQQYRPRLRASRNKAGCRWGSTRRERSVGGTLFLQSRPRQEPCPVPDLRANPTKLACRCLVLGSATTASTRRRAVQAQTFHPPVQSRGLSSSSRARPLFWLCQSPPLAWPVPLVTVRVLPRNRLPATATWCVSASSPASAAPRFKQHHLQQVGIKTQSPCSIAQRERGLAAESGLRAPKAAPAPPCLLEPPSTETQHFSVRQSSIYVGL